MKLLTSASCFSSAVAVISASCPCCVTVHLNSLECGENAGCEHAKIQGLQLKAVYRAIDCRRRGQLFDCTRSSALPPRIAMKLYLCTCGEKPSGRCILRGSFQKLRESYSGQTGNDRRFHSCRSWLSAFMFSSSFNPLHHGKAVSSMSRPALILFRNDMQVDTTSALSGLDASPTRVIDCATHPVFFSSASVPLQACLHLIDMSTDWSGRRQAGLEEETSCTTVAATSAFQHSLGVGYWDESQTANGR